MSKASVLVVEDSFIVAYHLKTTLESDSYEVIGTCDSGEAAIAFVKNRRPDLVLMDIMLTGELDGIETSTILKSDFDIPVIYITALTDKDTIARAKITEPYGYLTKPFEDREIFTLIEMALYKHSIESRLRESEEKYFSTINSISDAVISIDRNYAVNYMNPTAISLTHQVLNDAVGKSIFDVLKLKNSSSHEVDVNPLQCPLNSSNTNTMPDDLVLVSATGMEIPIGESSLSLRLDRDGKFVGMIIIFKDLTEKKEHERILQEIDIQRKAALIEGQERERARIAKDLHDGLGQMLTAIKMNTTLIIQNQQDAANLSRLLDEAIQESVRISENLLPAKLRDFDLTTCLRSLSAQVNRSVATNISFYSDGIKATLSQSQKVNFYRIAQEAVHNSIKHAAAANIAIQLTETPSVLRLSIEDDGTGIMAKAGMRQNGLMNMRDRAEIMGGKLVLESDPRRGTVVIVEVPIAKLVEHE